MNTIKLVEGNNEVTVAGMDIIVRVQIYNCESYNVYIVDVNEYHGQDDPYGDCEGETRIFDDLTAEQIAAYENGDEIQIEVDAEKLAAEAREWTAFQEEYEETLQEQERQSEIEAKIMAKLEAEEQRELQEKMKAASTERAINAQPDKIELTIGENTVTINNHEVTILLQRDRNMDSVTAYVTCADNGYLPWDVEITTIAVDEDDADADIVVVMPSRIVGEAVEEWLDAEEEFLRQMEDDDAAMDVSRQLREFAQWVMENHPDARTEDLPYLLTDKCGRAAFGGWREVKGRDELVAVERRAATNEILTAIEADEMFGKARNTTSTNCRRGCFPSARQSGATWLIHIDDVSSFYGVTEKLLELCHDDDPDEVFDDGESTLEKIRKQQLRDDD